MSEEHKPDQPSQPLYIAKVIGASSDDITIDMEYFTDQINEVILAMAAGDETNNVPYVPHSVDFNSVGSQGTTQVRHYVLMLFKREGF